MKKLNKKITFNIEKTRTGYSASADAYNIYSTGKSIAKLHQNIIEALNLYFENENIYADHSNIKLQLDLAQFFKFYRVINAKFLAERINMNPSLLSQYIQGHKQPSSKQTEKILNGIHTIGKELAELKFL